MGILIIRQLLVTPKLIGCVVPFRNIVSYVALPMQESHPVDWAKDASSPKPRVDHAELAGSEETPSNYKENANLYIAIKCFIIPCVKYNHVEYVNVLISTNWGEGTSQDVVSLKMFC